MPGINGASITNNRARGQWVRVKMERFVRDIGYHVDRPIVDVTDLKGTYDLSLYWVPDQTRQDAGGPTILGALQDQLGLKLESRKVTIPIVIVDHAEKVPTEN
jgi:uncharacterized protein (TIGR03435 family)